MGGETTRVENRGEPTRGETTREETSWGRNVLLPYIHTFGYLFELAIKGRISNDSIKIYIQTWA